mmetsp:Transcript_37518/g.82086  ORF Transcript_37518/g.82086 Transcript_37518/m.82086 type:complete len:309 (+) Transcript_37518:54-980(+)|eukprot:CAMPEP_0204261332 /NCGR_PEP_ID=MMETSP0468-20130131/6931_1 /ASSEMBLY_ACC=CAM_ASM_000383 /TAXON_ID=2969 /ORGANISM="Oxyrrhis marina" /LENGTH=308 /DNA_ID=CAMNT_0051235859 /DNA_START=46 /DNA_END=972 /DNA_ORIENTATION=-
MAFRPPPGPGFGPPFPQGPPGMGGPPMGMPPGMPPMNMGPGMGPPGMPPIPNMQGPPPSMPPGSAPGAMPPMPSLPPMSAAQEELPPNVTLYVNNLNDKVGCEVLKKSLREVFAAFGDIQDIVCMKSLKRRGQAWIIFADVNAATTALKSLQGFPFYNKPMRINYAKTKSDVVAKADGTFVERPKRVLRKDDRTLAKKRAVAATDGTPTAVPGGGMPPGMGYGGGGMPPSSEPNRTLFVTGLPPDANEAMLTMLFRQYAGFMEVRLIAGRGVAFVDFASAPNAQLALQGLQGFQAAPGAILNISFAKQ